MQHMTHKSIVDLRARIQYHIDTHNKAIKDAIIVHERNIKNHEDQIAQLQKVLDNAKEMDPAIAEFLEKSIKWDKV